MIRIGCPVAACSLVILWISLVGCAQSGKPPQRGLTDWLDDFKDTIGGDPLFERLITQIWSVHESAVHQNASMMGMNIDPINMDEKMGALDIPVKQGFVESNARLQGIQVHGLSSMYLDRSTMKRKDKLEDLNMDVTMRFDQIFINGTYRVETMGMEVIPGNHFSVGLSKCYCSYLMHMALLDFIPGFNREAGKKNRCTKGDEPDVQLLDLRIPLDCLALDFNFFGAADWLVEVLGLTVIKQVIEFATNMAKDQINWLLCGAPL